MECRKIKEKIDLYIDGLLSFEEKELFETHIRECPACNLEYTKSAALVNAARAVREEEVPETFSADLKIRLAKAAQSKEAWIPDLFRKPAIKVFAATAAALLIIFIAGGIFKNGVDLSNGQAGLKAESQLTDACYTDPPGDAIKYSEETLAATGFAASRFCANTVITVLTENPEEQMDNFALFAEAYGAIRTDPAEECTESVNMAQSYAGCDFSVPKDAYGIIMQYLKDKYPSANIDYQEISVPGETESNYIINITFKD
ncbi:MAG: zf-HC2 domain-containing protein [Eubacteriales bacterium]|nr:zf-HC2 domain-containing protein [Eubacteriales bacterium]